MIPNYLLKFFRRIYTHSHSYSKDQEEIENQRDFCGQSANDFIYNRICNSNNTGLMISKFGTIELESITGFIARKKKITYKDYFNYCKGKVFLYPKENLKMLCNNAGFFPNDLSLQEDFDKLCINDSRFIDVLVSYLTEEKYLSNELKKATKIDLDGFLAPYLWKNPWSMALEGKKVLVIHPFVDSIKKQYSRRELIFKDRNVLPTFKKLILIKAVQSIGGNSDNSNFKTWFDALHFMEKQIDLLDFDIAIIGCGAYGMNLAAYIKRKGKIALHMAGWTQMLFGIYGKRWIDQPKYSSFINEYWIRPNELEKPTSYKNVENGCYW